LGVVRFLRGDVLAELLRGLSEREILAHYQLDSFKHPRLKR
jgi:hypothetical protein